MSVPTWINGFVLINRHDTSFIPCWAYHGDHAAGADAVVDANHALVVRVLPSAEEVLVAQVVGSLIHHETATLHADGVAAVEVGVQVSTIAHALMVPTLEISVLVEYDLQMFVKALIHYQLPLCPKHLKAYMFSFCIFSNNTTHLTFPIVLLVGARLMLNRRSLCRCPFILSSCVMAQHKVLSSK